MRKIRQVKVISNKRGVTLIELIVSIAVTSILIAALSSLIFPIQSLYARSESKIIMNNVGQKLLNELAVCTASSTKLVVLTEQNPTVNNVDDYKVFLSGNYVVKRHKAGDEIPILISENSYQNCKVKSLEFFVAEIEESQSFEISAKAKFRRILKIRIKLSLRNLESDYMYTTVKLYNFSTSGAEIVTKTGARASTTTTYKSVIITPYK